jgi:hypothetical protein
MRARPRKSQDELNKKRPKSIDPNGQDPSDDPSGSPPWPKLDTHDVIEKLLADPKQRADGLAFGENRDLAAAIKATFKASRKPVDDGVPRFVLTWRMYPNKDSSVAGTAGNCGCGCSCS